MPGQSSQWVATARVLRRAGFGVSGPEVDAAVRQDWPSYVEAMLGANPDADPGAIATPMPSFTAAAPPGKGATPAARKQYNQQMSEQQRVLSDWWLQRMAAVRQPVHEKLTLLWHNHFATSAQKVRAAAQMAAQNQKLRTLALGDFRTLAYAMLTDAAMLRWLDGQTNTAKAPNENLAREFMELFALGHGNGYTEDDVRAGARALTGWVDRPRRPDLDGPQRHDAGAKTVLGVTATSTRPDSATPCWPSRSQPNTSRRGCGSSWLPTTRRHPQRSTGCRRLRPGPQPARTDRGDPHRRRIHRRPGHQRQHAGRVAGRRDPDAAGSPRHARAAEMADADVARAGPTTVLPAQTSAAGRSARHGCPPPAPRHGCAPRVAWRTSPTCPASRAPPRTTASTRSAICSVSARGRTGPPTPWTPGRPATAAGRGRRQHT